MERLGIMLERKLKKLKKSGSARLEYQCSDCGYIVYMPILGKDIEEYLSNWNEKTLLACPSCFTRTLELLEVWGEKEWLRVHKYAEG